MEKKEIIFAIKVMSGGGAERVVSLLSSSMVDKGYSVILLLTHQSEKDAILDNIDSSVQIISLVDHDLDGTKMKLFSYIYLFCSRVLGKIGKMFSTKLFQYSLTIKYLAYNYSKIELMRKIFRKHKNSTVVAFLYDSIFYSLLSVTKSNKLIISERGDPCQSLASKTTMAFLKNEFQKADGFVFQSPDVQHWYKDNTKVRGTVIFNPIKNGLPEPYFGERRKSIVNFCRINPQKNLPLLLDAFELFAESFPEYELHIYGDASTEADIQYFETVKEKRESLKSKDRVFFFPASRDIHRLIRDYSMFVSSSDFEGMSNSMLEALALGLPCVCTDCPAGGARAVIKDGENGLLVPVNDAVSLSEAMKRIISEKGLSEKLSENAVKIRDEQSLEKIIEKWMEIIE
ncbi:MAG: glycosyltransferase family 4 protein [Ruminococcaceae bacterium]|nr:glycosyltransferase family 4 protein [Oscillospiraceae bacterium]